MSIGCRSNIAISVWGSHHRGIGARNGSIGAGVGVDTLVSIVPRLSLSLGFSFSFSLAKMMNGRISRKDGLMKSIGVAIGARVVRSIGGVWVNAMGRVVPWLSLSLRFGLRFSLSLRFGLRFSLSFPLAKMMNGRMVSIGDGSNIDISVWGSHHEAWVRGTV